MMTSCKTTTLGMFRTVAESSSPMTTRWSRMFAGKTADRSAVHGLKQPPTHTLDDARYLSVHSDHTCQREKIEQEIKETAKEQGNRRKEIEDKVDSQLNKSENVVSESPESLSSS